MNGLNRISGGTIRGGPRNRFDLHAYHVLPIVLVACPTLLVGCPGGSSDENKPDPAPETTAPPTPTRPAPDKGAQPDPDNWQVSLYQERFEFASGSSFYIENLFGDLRMRPSDDGNTVLTGALQGEKEDSIQPRIEHSETSGRVEIRVRFPNPDGGPDLTPKQVGKRRVDLTVFLGKSADVKAKTRHGLLESKSLPGPLVVESESAHMRLVVKNTLEAHCGYGRVEVFFKSPKDYHPPKVTTVTGDIRVEFPEDIDAEVRIETSGQLTSDFSTEVARESGAQYKKAIIRLGKDGREVPLSSKSGNIIVLEKPSLRPLQGSTQAKQAQR